MTAYLVDQRPHATAIKAAIKAQFGPNNVYEYGQVPGANGVAGTLPNIFAIISLERRSNTFLRLPARAGNAGWRLAVRTVGRTVDECRWAQLRVADALNEARLTVGDKPTTPLQYEAGDAPTFDDGRFSAVDYYTFAH